jgi:Undecaprenyl-phosphate glucose phosphotransferase
MTVGTVAVADMVDDRKRVSLVRWTFGLINRLVGASDILLICTAAVFSSHIPAVGYTNPLSALQILLLATAQCMIYLAVLTRIQAYRVERYTDRLAAGIYLVLGLVPAWTAGFLVLIAFRPETLSAPQWLLAWNALTFGLLLASRQVQATLLRDEARRHLLRRRVVIIGANAVAEHVIRDLSSHAKGETYEIVALFRAESESPSVASIGGVPVSGSLVDLRNYAQSNTIDTVVIALPWSARELHGLAEQVSWIAADIIIPFEQKSLNTNFARVMRLGDMPALLLMSRPFKGSQGVLKVVEDYLVASLAMILLAPLMLLVALAIRLESPGPILFRQRRPGFGTKPFTILKFRTMYVDPQDDATTGTTGPNDKRVTRVGAVLRRLSLDELPQILNVLRGEMSIVGPRPYVADMLVGNERYSDLVRDYAERHRVKPGITGYAQAHGLRSYALRVEANARKSIEMDLLYMRNWSLWLDIVIMIRTLVVGMAGRNVF